MSRPGHSRHFNLTALTVPQTATLLVLSPTCSRAAPATPAGAPSGGIHTAHRRQRSADAHVRPHARSPPAPPPPDRLRVAVHSGAAERERCRSATGGWEAAPRSPSPLRSLPDGLPSRAAAASAAPPPPLSIAYSPLLSSSSRLLAKAAREGTHPTPPPPHPPPARLRSGPAAEGSPRCGGDRSAASSALAGRHAHGSTTRSSWPRSQAGSAMSSLSLPLSTRKSRAATASTRVPPRVPPRASGESRAAAQRTGSSSCAYRKVPGKV